MKAHRLLVMVLILVSYYADAQDQWSFESHIEFETYSSFEGTIGGRYPIKMYLEESYRPCQTNDVYRWTPRMVYGWYMYDKIGKKIPLVGHTCYADACETALTLFVPEDFTNFSLDGDCNMPDAKEVFRIEPGNKSMFWQMGDGELLPVQLKAVHVYSWATKARILLSMEGIEMTSFNLNELADIETIESIEILSQKAASGSFHLIIKYYHQSNPGSFGHGSCGAGLETYIAYIEVGQDFVVDTFQQIQVESCLRSGDNVDVEYDPSRPELGIRVK